MKRSERYRDLAPSNENGFFGVGPRRENQVHPCARGVIAAALVLETSGAIREGASPSVRTRASPGTSGEVSWLVPRENLNCINKKRKIIPQLGYSLIKKLYQLYKSIYLLWQLFYSAPF